MSEVLRSLSSFTSIPLFDSEENLPSQEPLPLNKWYVIDPQDEASSYRWKAIGARTLMAIAVVAAIALASSVVVFTFLAPSGAVMPLGVALGSIAGAFLVPVAKWLYVKGEEYSLLAEKEQRIAGIYQELLKMDLEEINQKPFLQASGIEITEDLLDQVQNALPEDSNLDGRQACLLVLARLIEHCEHATRYKYLEFPNPKTDNKSHSETQKNILYQRYWESREHVV